MNKNTFERSAVNRAGLVFLVALILVSSIYAAQPFTGKCVGVTDGDTISVMKEGRAVKVRLEGIDCPEAGQDFSNSAKKIHLSSRLWKDRGGPPNR